MDKNLITTDPWQPEDIQLPNEDAAWQHMKVKLDEDESKHRVVPFKFFQYGGMLVLLLLTIATAWFLMKGGDPHEPAVQKEIAKTEKQSHTSVIDKAQNNSSSEQQNEKDIPDARDINGHVIEHDASISGIPGKIDGVLSSKDEPANKMISTEPIRADKRRENFSANPGITGNSNKEVQKLQRVPAEILRSKLSELPSIIIRPERNKYQSPTAVVSGHDGRYPKFRYGFGLGLQQQVPFHGQSGIAYNYQGRKGSFADYIPSVFFRMEKEDKWFLLAEFRFSAPQSLKEFSYNRKTVFDATSGQLVTTKMNLRKTYYHQFPLSFNYFVKPGFSIGAGGMYSRFQGAVSEREVSRKNLATQLETVTRQIAPIGNYTDSFLYKSQVHLLLQTAYEWNRLSVGLRYTRDLQPYIRYTRPDGNISEEKNQTLQILVRFRLWDSSL